MSEYKCSCGHAIKNHGAVGCQCGCQFTKSDLLFAEMKQRAERAEQRVKQLKDANKTLEIVVRGLRDRESQK